MRRHFQMSAREVLADAPEWEIDLLLTELTNDRE